MQLWTDEREERRNIKEDDNDEDRCSQWTWTVWNDNIWSRLSLAAMQYRPPVRPDM